MFILTPLLQIYINSSSFSCTYHVGPRSSHLMAMVKDPTGEVKVLLFNCRLFLLSQVTYYIYRRNACGTCVRIDLHS